jgi:hypothetical protein
MSASATVRITEPRAKGIVASVGCDELSSAPLQSRPASARCHVDAVLSSPFLMSEKTRMARGHRAAGKASADGAWFARGGRCSCAFCRTGAVAATRPPEPPSRRSGSDGRTVLGHVIAGRFDRQQFIWRRRRRFVILLLDLTPASEGRLASNHASHMTIHSRATMAH